jgi:hypothetical protein
VNIYTCLVNIETESSDQELDVQHHPKWSIENILAMLHRWTSRTIKHKDQGSRNLDKSAELEE